jgi:hypothetical protein
VLGICRVFGRPFSIGGYDEEHSVLPQTQFSHGSDGSDWAVTLRGVEIADEGSLRGVH